MNKGNSLYGLGNVFRFTFSQLIKNKANLISFGIFILVAMLAIPVMSIFMDEPAVETGTAFYTDVMTMEEFLNRDEISFDARYIVQYGYSIVVMMITLFSCTYIVRAILEEKSSKLVETLLVSIKSEAMILGKILAVIAFVFLMFVIMAVAFALSYFVTGMFTSTAFVGSFLESMGITGEIFNIGIELVAVIIVSLLLACVLLSQIAALSGAGCSTMEDMESANMSATMVVLVCYMATVIASAFGSTPALPMSLIPFVSAFAAPTYYVTGDISGFILILSWVIQIATIAAIYKLSGKAYDTLIMYKGKRLKMIEIFRLSLGKPLKKKEEK